MERLRPRGGLAWSLGTRLAIRSLVQRNEDPFAPAECGLHRITEAHADLVIHHQPVNDRLDGVAFLRV